MQNPKAYRSYFGGKSGNGTYQTIINHIPPHSLYVSLFLGNDAVYRHIKPAAACLLNDLDRDVVAAWQSFFKADYLHALRNDNALLMLNDMAYTLNQFWAQTPSLVPFVFLDPPYLLSTRKNQRPVYRHEMSIDGHTELLRCVTRPALKDTYIMLCCYPNELYSRYLDELPNWHYIEFYSTIRGGVALERLYMNYELNGQLHDYRYLGGNFREREKFNRIKNNLISKLSKLPDQLRNSIVADIVKALDETT